MEKRESRFLSSPVKIDPLAQDIKILILILYTDIKIANNKNINYVMVSFTDLYNTISIDRLPSKTKIRKDS